jgi:hypothetical protein
MPANAHKCCATLVQNITRTCGELIAAIAVAAFLSDFILFAAVLVVSRSFNRYTLQIALSGLAAISVVQDRHHRLSRTGAGIEGFVLHLQHDVGDALRNLLGLLLGFALLSKHFEDSQVPARVAEGSCPTTGKAASCCWR